jgi:hypothetical protein
MDAINKSVGFKPTIVPDQQENQTEQISETVSISGIASVPDTFETAALNPINFAPANTPVKLTTDGILNTLQTETVEASSIFDLISADPSARVDAEAFQGTGDVRWDCIEQIKAAMNRGDNAAVLDILQNIRPNELGPTLTQMAKQGTPSDLQLMTDQICKKPDFAMMDPWLVTMLERYSTDSTVKLPLQQMLNRISGKPDADTLIRGIYEHTKGQNILGKLDQSILTPMYNTLQSQADMKIANALCANAIFGETGIEPEHCAGTEFTFENPDALFQKELDKGLPSQDLSDFGEAMRLFPEWGVGAMKQANEKGKLSQLMLYALVHPNTSSPLLAAVCKQTDSGSIVTEVFREVKKYNNTDKTIRDMLDYLGSSALPVLSKLPPLVLMDIKTILENGAEKELNQPVLQNFIRPALNAAIFHEKLTQTAQSDFEFPLKNLQ